MNRHEVESGAHGAEPPLERRAEALAVLGFESIRVGLSDGLCRSSRGRNLEKKLAPPARSQSNQWGPSRSAWTGERSSKHRDSLQEKPVRSWSQLLPYWRGGPSVTAVPVKTYGGNGEQLPGRGGYCGCLSGCR